MARVSGRRELRIAIEGNIAAGKSTFLKILVSECGRHTMPLTCCSQAQESDVRFIAVQEVTVLERSSPPKLTRTTYAADHKMAERGQGQLEWD
jgi:ATPase subunit of ABC transporter with duplicated ATPase domains